MIQPLSAAPPTRPAPVQGAPAAASAGPVDIATVGGPAATSIATVGGPAATSIATVGGPAAPSIATVGGPAATSIATVGGPAAPSIPSARGLAALAVGPIPDFAPLSGVVAHVLASDLSNEMVQQLHQRLGDRYDAKPLGYGGPRSGYRNVNLVWMRDYTPTFVKRADGTAGAVKFLSNDAERSGYVGDEWVPVPGPSNRHRLFREPGQTTGGHWLETRTSPLNHEGGNQISTGRHVFVGERLLMDNAKPGTREMNKAGYRPRPGAEVVKELAGALEVPEQQVVILPWMPGEKTGHVDLYLMALAPERVMIPEVRPEALAQLTYGHEQELGGQVRAFLDQRAEQLRGLGYQVDRLPMLPPVNLRPAPSGGWHGVFYSPANALLQNLPEGRSVLLPTFQAEGFPPAYQELNRSYRDQWASYFREAGWEPALADATRLGEAYGLFRCLTEPIPQFD